jgi:cystathionine beta-lyase
MAIRLDQHQRSATQIARWLEGRAEVARVLYPALESDPGHAIWKRDMTGASGLFAVIMRGWSQRKAKAFIDHLELFGIGASWGGFESLITLPAVHRTRSATARQADGPLLRIHVGLEDAEDLKADLEAAFEAVRATD